MENKLKEEKARRKTLLEVIKKKEDDRRIKKMQELRRKAEMEKREAEEAEKKTKEHMEKQQRAFEEWRRRKMEANQQRRVSETKEDQYRAKGSNSPKTHTNFGGEMDKKPEDQSEKTKQCKYLNIKLDKPIFIKRTIKQAVWK